MPAGEFSGAIEGHRPRDERQHPGDGVDVEQPVADVEPSGALPVAHPKPGEHHDHRGVRGEHVDQPPAATRAGSAPDVLGSSPRSSGKWRRVGNLTLTGVRRRGLELLRDPVEQGVDLGHPVAAEGQREPHPADVGGVQRAVPGDQRVGPVVVRLASSGRRDRRRARPRRP